MGLKRLRVRGLKAVKLSILLKLTGWNVLRGAALHLVLKQERQKVALKAS
jgi:hypothetical protein